MTLPSVSTRCYELTNNGAKCNDGWRARGTLLGIDSGNHGDADILSELTIQVFPFTKFLLIVIVIKNIIFRKVMIRSEWIDDQAMSRLQR